MSVRSAKSTIEEEVRRAAAERDPVRMLQALAESGLPEKIERHIERKFDRLDEEDARWIVATIVDSLYERLSNGHEVRTVSNWLYKAAENKATDLSGELGNRVSLDEWDAVAPDLDPLETEEERDRRREAAEAAVAARRKRLFQVAKGLVPCISQTRPRQVMGILFDAWEKGVVDLTNEEIAAYLPGTTKNAVAIAKIRGREALIELAKAEGLDSFDLSARDVELPDEAEALAAEEEEL